MFYFKLDETSELRLLEKRHAPQVFALTRKCRTYLRRWLPWVDPKKTVADTEKFIETSLAQFAANNGFTAGIWHRGTFAGCIGYHWIDWPNSKTSIGYWLGERFQGKGLMTRACRALVAHSFREWKLNRVEIRVAVENKKSRAIPERLGFKEEGVLRQYDRLYDRFLDMVMYGMLAGEWK